MEVKTDLVVIKVLLHSLTIDVEDVQVHDGQAATPFLVAIGEITSRCVKDVVDEGEVVLDLLVALDVETLGGLNDCCFEIRHDE